MTKHGDYTTGSRPVPTGLAAAPQGAGGPPAYADGEEAVAVQFARLVEGPAPEGAGPGEPEAVWAVREGEGDPWEAVDAPPWAAWRRTGWRVPAGGVQLLASARPSKIVAIGRNYADHAAEFNNPLPEELLIFLKAPSSIVGPGEPIVLPSTDRRIDHEGELVIVIGRRCRRVPRAAALTVVLGYTCGNDVSDRVLQRRDGQFARAKSFDSFTPLGPVIATGLDPAALRVTVAVNGEVRQDAPTTALHFDVPTLIAFVSDVMTLEPGDLIMTGTPAGVSALAPGDRVAVTIPGIGTLENHVVGPSSQMGLAQA